MLIYLASCHVCSLYSILVCLSFPVDIIDKADTIEYRMILPNHKIKPWNQFIKISDSKINFIRFLCNERKTSTFDEECFTVTAENVKEVSYFGYNHEEADMQIFSHAKKTSQSEMCCYNLRRHLRFFNRNSKARCCCSHLDQKEYSKQNTVC